METTRTQHNTRIREAETSKNDHTQRRGCGRAGTRTRWWGAGRCSHKRWFFSKLKTLPHDLAIPFLSTHLRGKGQVIYAKTGHRECGSLMCNSEQQETSHVLIRRWVDKKHIVECWKMGYYQQSMKPSVREPTGTDLRITTLRERSQTQTEHWRHDHGNGSPENASSSWVSHGRAVLLGDPQGTAGALRWHVFALLTASMASRVGPCIQTHQIVHFKYAVYSMSIVPQ